MCTQTSMKFLLIWKRLIGKSHISNDPSPSIRSFQLICQNVCIHLQLQLHKLSKSLRSKVAHQAADKDGQPVVSGHQLIIKDGPPVPVAGIKHVNHRFFDEHFLLAILYKKTTVKKIHKQTNKKRNENLSEPEIHQLLLKIRGDLSFNSKINCFFFYCLFCFWYDE